ncbi:MAG TPA: DUF192 domain-containing protein [Thermomicrobiales bacterium]|nr:DUF192 domain-containing protein [Thermomicrobiales bacterium]
MSFDRFFRRRSRPASLATAAFVVVFATLALAGGALAQESAIRPPWQAAQVPDRQTATITVGTTPLTAELAITPAERERGLGYRAGLEPGTGMLFIDSEARVQTFWMKGMRFCLDIVWIDGAQIVGAAESVCPMPFGTPDDQLPIYSSPEAVKYVLEVPAGWLAANGYGAGTPVDLSAAANDA